MAVPPQALGAEFGGVAVGRKFVAVRSRLGPRAIIHREALIECGGRHE